MKSPEQLKGAVKNIAKQKNISPQAVLQTLMFERLVERLSVSEYRDKFILKGGLLISSMVGIGERTTMDMDTTVKGLDMNEEQVKDIIEQIVKTEVNDDVAFVFKGIQPIREDDEYENFRVSLQAIYGKMKIPMKMDITTGDIITPREIIYHFPLTFEDRSVAVWAYTLETILAEKYETIIRRGTANTRARDFYDLYILHKVYSEKINRNDFQKAVALTSKKRGSESGIKDAEDILREIQDSDAMNRLWEKYRKENLYARDIVFETVMECVREIEVLLRQGEEVIKNEILYC